MQQKRLRALLDVHNGSELIYDDGNRRANILILNIIVSQVGGNITFELKNTDNGKVYKTYGYEMPIQYQLKSPN